MKKLMFFTAFFLMSTSSYSQHDAAKNTLGRFLTDEVTKATNGFIEVYDEREGYSKINLAEYTSFDLVRVQIALLFQQQANYTIYRAWQENLGTIQMILREKSSGYIFMIVYSENKKNNKAGMLVIWDYGMCKKIVRIEKFNLKENEFDNK